MKKDYCKHCGRWLATHHPDGSFDIAPRAVVVAMADLNSDVIGAQAARSIPGSARCLHWRCRIKDWIQE